MRKQKSFLLMIFAALVLACLQTAAFGQTNDKLANVTGGGSSVRWDVLVANSGMSLTISFPDGRSLTREYKAGASPEITLNDRQLESLPDGAYGYELRLRPVLSPAEREALNAARGKDDEPEAERAMRKRPVLPVLVQAGSFAIMNRAIIVGGASEGQRSTPTLAEPKQSTGVISGNTVTRLRNHRMSLFAMPDFVIADDLIVQGSACIGLDCVNGESFSFDTIRLKENNTRISFNDTSVGSFPTNDWTIRANSSASGGDSFLAFVDRGTSENGDEVGTIVFVVEAGAAANSLKVDGTSRVGLRTATPVLDLHIATSNTPAQRLEQTNAGGFTAQTWDVAGNEANFFIRDITAGSRLPFRIRPGAPTSSIDIAASGNVGIGKASAVAKLQVVGAGNALPATSGTTQSGGVITRLNEISTAIMDIGSAAGTGYWLQVTDSTSLAANYPLLLNPNGGNVGIGTSAPTQTLSVNGTAGKPGGGTWDVFSDERLKNIKGQYHSGLKALMQLQPIRYEYKSNNPLGIKSEGENIGFGAQALQKVIPEAVTMNSSGYLMVKSDPILWTMLNAIKEQQQEIVELKGQIRKLQAASHRRRK